MSAFRSITIIVLALVLSCPAFGQEDNTKIYGNYTRSELIEESSDLMQFLNDVLIVSVTTPEVSLKQFVEMLQEKSPIHLNVIVLDDAKEIRIPPIKLTNVTAGAVINALRVATNELVTFDYDESGQVGFFGRSEDYVPSSEVSVVNLANVLSSYTNESFLSAVEIGMKMMGSDNSSIQMKLHEETSTLFLKGSEKEIELVMQIVDQMSGQNQVRQLYGIGGNAADRLGDLLGNGAGGAGGLFRGQRGGIRSKGGEGSMLGGGGAGGFGGVMPGQRGGKKRSGGVIQGSGRGTGSGGGASDGQTPKGQSSGRGSNDNLSLFLGDSAGDIDGSGGFFDSLGSSPQNENQN